MTTIQSKNQGLIVLQKQIRKATESTFNSKTQVTEPELQQKYSGLPEEGKLGWVRGVRGKLTKINTEEKTYELTSLEDANVVFTVSKLYSI